MSDYPDNPYMDAPPPPEEAMPAPKDQLTRLKGTVEHIIYANEDNGYTVLDFGLEDDVVTACGTMPYVSDGDSLILWGNWVHNPKYGRQFKVEEYERDMPADSAAILRYLSARTIKGVGPKLAERMPALALKSSEISYAFLREMPGTSASQSG